MAERKYKVIKVKLPTGRKGFFYERWFISENKIPNFMINEWIDIKSLRRVSTGKEYANKLVVFFNFLDSIGKNIEECNGRDVINFIKNIMYRSSNKVINIGEVQVSQSTLEKYIVVIKGFYHWLDKSNIKSSNLNNKYYDIWGEGYKREISLLVRQSTYVKTYIRWYTEKEKKILLENFKLLRDKAMFLITLEGFRIDEVLSMKLDGYDFATETIKPSRSKGKKTNKLRVIKLPKETCEVLDRYIRTERVEAEIQSGELSEYIFLNIKKGPQQGKPLQYKNALDRFKGSAKRAGIDPNLIKTHSGRSTKTMEMLEHQALYPEDCITDEMIRTHMGWDSLESIDFYKNFNNTTITKAVAEKIYKRKFENNEN